jgi:5-(hydroxymethyl)furfural/furfural oxidase
VPELRPFYDIIVVGAGTAGAVVAQTLARLLPAKSILVIESGPNLDPSLPVAIEPANSANLFVAQSDSRRQQPPQAFTRTSALRSGEVHVPASAAHHFPNYIQGRGWGGSGAINGLVCQPGHPADYDRWAYEYGCTGWSWADIGPILTELQSQLFISTPSMYQAADHALVTAFRAHEATNPSGLHLTPAALCIADNNPRPRTTGNQPTLRDRRGQPGENSFGNQRDQPAPRPTVPAFQRKLLGLEADTNRPNLQLAFGIDVVRVLTEGRVAVGVQLGDGTQVQTHHVIVSAGAIGSPALLQRSGIGRPSVGQNLHDHTSVSVTLRLSEKPTSTEIDQSPNAQELDPGFTPTNVLLESYDHIHILPVSKLPDDPTLGVWMASPFQAIHGRGSVTAQPDGTNEVRFNSFSDERDRFHLRKAARLLGQLLDEFRDQPNDQLLGAGPQPLFDSREFWAKPVEPNLTEQLRTLNDHDLDTWVLNNQGSYYHAGGTCRMGAADDPRSVVDLLCAILDWCNISVIDASIFPDLPTANPCLPTVAAAQLAATRLATHLRA